MANLEFIEYMPMREIISDGDVRWIPDTLARRISGLPQIFWGNGEPWAEANHWALTKATSTQGGHIKTVAGLMKHLAAYAEWLEATGSSWRHFPIRRSERTIVIFRGVLIEQRKKGMLAPSTTRSRMAAIIQFYRHAQAFRFLQSSSPMWSDRNVIVRFNDTAGVERTLLRISSELSIPNARINGARLEDGLTPLKIDDAVALLKFSQQQGLRELNLMLSLGVLTGARIETITTLGVKDIENAWPDAQTPDTYRVRIGPGTDVKTKFDVSGELMVPSFLIMALKEYAYCMQRLRRQALATEANRGVLFLTVRGNPYSPGTFNRLMTDLRRRGIDAGLRFMKSFKFHQTRATFGTWLMEVVLKVAKVKAAVAFVRDAMLHKDERTTFLYVTFVEDAPVKPHVANEFSAVFSGVINRNWDEYDA